jgi:ribosome-binding protein aMBF1 (putative translation factor)
MKIIEVKNCVNSCKLCKRNNNSDYAIVFDNYVLTVCKDCLNELKGALLNETME